MKNEKIRRKTQTEMIEALNVCTLYLKINPPNKPVLTPKIVLVGYFRFKNKPLDC
jgi:hypothetical protein